jgi:hypothetical protein
VTNFFIGFCAGVVVAAILYEIIISANGWGR